MYFCYQRGLNGRTPVMFDERPNKDWDMCSGVIWETVREVPKDMEGVGLYALQLWDAFGGKR